MFHTIEEFTLGWNYESQGTQKLLDQLTDKSLAQAVAKDHRTIGRIAWHITTAIPEMMGHTGLRLPAVDASAPVPKTAAEIGKAYAAVSKQLLEQVKANWKDATLLTVDEMYGEKWPRGMTLDVLIKHQTHHRGQLTVLIRQAGLPVPGVYGPSKEEWVKYGAPAPEI